MNYRVFMNIIFFIL